VALAAALNLIANTLARARRWRALLPRLPPPSPASRRPSTLELAELVLASLATSNVLPLRAGEAVRMLELRRRHAYPVLTLVAVQLVEKLVELGSLTLVAVPVVLAPDPSSPPALRAVCLGAASFCLGVVLVLGWARRSGASPIPGTGRLTIALSRALEALQEVGSRRALLGSLAWALVSDLLDVLMIGLCLRALGIGLSPAAWFEVLIAVNVAIAIPATPAQIGILEAGAVLVLMALGTSRDAALAFALVYHAVHVIPVTAAGALIVAARSTRPPSGPRSVEDPHPAHAAGGEP
jgi:uncharacterized membrane protein YbhN (UPF0104 family)